MRLSDSDLNDLADLAILAAKEAGKMISQSRPQLVDYKSAVGSLASQVVTEIDRQSEQLILDRLQPTLRTYDLGLLTEERDDDRRRLTADYFWCIDPLDGTLPFVEQEPGYAVSIALVGRDGVPWLGVVYDPVEGVLVHAIRGLGAFRDGAPWTVEFKARAEGLSVFVDRSFVKHDEHSNVVESLETIAHDLGLSGVHIHATGGAVMNALNVLANPSACYFKYPASSGGGSLWDFAATACVFREVGAFATDIHGQSLDLNRSDSTFMNHRGLLFATDAVLAQRIRALASSEV